MIWFVLFWIVCPLLIILDSSTSNIDLSLSLFFVKDVFFVLSLDKYLSLLSISGYELAWGKTLNLNDEQELPANFDSWLWLSPET